MKNTDILSRITALLNKKVTLAQDKLDNGTVIESDSFAVGDPIFAIDGENKIPLGIGEYTLENGSKIEVIEIGIIASVEAVEAPEAPEELAEEPKEEPKEKLAEEEEKEKMEEIPASLEQIVEAVMAALQPKFDEMELKYKKMSEGQNDIKETLSSTVAKKPLVHKPAYNDVVASTNTRNNISGTESRIMAMLSK